MKLTPSHRLYGLGVVLLVALAICAHYFSRTGEPSFIIPLAAAGVAYLLAIRELFSAAELPRRVIVFGLALAAVWHIQFLRMPPIPTKAFRVRDGLMFQCGRNDTYNYARPPREDCETIRKSIQKTIKGTER